MTRFEFSLQRLLDLRIAAARAQAVETGLANQEAERAQTASRDRASELEAVHDQLGDTAAVPAGLRHAWGLTAAAARHRMASAAEALQEAEALRQEAQHKLTDALAARRSLERLRGKREADWSVEHGRENQAQDDEVARQHRQQGEKST